MGDLSSRIPATRQVPWYASELKAVCLKFAEVRRTPVVILAKPTAACLAQREVRVSLPPPFIIDGAQFMPSMSLLDVQRPHVPAECVPRRGYIDTLAS